MRWPTTSSISSSSPSSPTVNLSEVSFRASPVHLKWRLADCLKLIFFVVKIAIAKKKTNDRGHRSHIFFSFCSFASGVLRFGTKEESPLPDALVLATLVALMKSLSLLKLCRLYVRLSKVEDSDRNCSCFGLTTLVPHNDDNVKTHIGICPWIRSSSVPQEGVLIRSSKQAALQIHPQSKIEKEKKETRIEI